MTLEKFLTSFWKEVSCLQFEVMRKQYFHLYLTFLSRQLGNDDANDDENDIDNFFWINIEHMKYHKENNLYTMSQSEFQIIVPRQLSAAILLLFISATVGEFCSRRLLGTVTTIF